MYPKISINRYAYIVIKAFNISLPEADLDADIQMINYFSFFVIFGRLANT